MQPSEKEPEGSTKLLLCATILGIIFAVAFEKFNTDEHMLLIVLCGITGGIAVTLVGELRNQDRVVHTLAKWREDFTLNKRVFALVPLLKTAKDYERFARLARLYEQLDDNRSEWQPVVGFVEWKENQLFTQLETGLQEMVSGHLAVNDTAKELTSNEELLTTAASSAVSAVSYEDGTFWTTPAGKNFLLAHSRRTAQNISITRIFVVPLANPNDLLSILEAQVAAGVNVLIVDEESLSSNLKEDFVIYDSRIVRTAKRHGGPAAYVPKHAEIHINQNAVAEYVDKFNALKGMALSIDDFRSQHVKV